jgi:hypothetical protein
MVRESIVAAEGSADSVRGAAGRTGAARGTASRAGAAPTAGAGAGSGAAPLVRLLARLAGADVATHRDAFADRLSQWLGWTDAIALSAALNGPVPTAPVLRASDGVFARQRDALVRAMADDETRGARPAERGRAPRGTATRPEPIQAAADFPSLRRRYLAKQQAMEAGVAALREGLRAALTARSPALARLASVDAVMEQALGERERGLLSLVPAVLAQRFERLRQEELATHAAVMADSPTAVADESAAVAADPPAVVEPAPPATISGTWLARFRQDMHGLLMAELELRLQPVEGLIEALDAPV